MAQMPNAEITDKAKQLVTCLQMWDVERTDAYKIAKEMVSIIRDSHESTWINPLSGTGFSAIKRQIDK